MKRSLRKWRISSQRGDVLIQVLIAASVASIAILAVGTVMNNHLKEVQRATEKTKSVDLVRLISSTLSSGTVCNKMLDTNINGVSGINPSGLETSFNVMQYTRNNTKKFTLVKIPSMNDFGGAGAPLVAIPAATLTAQERKLTTIVSKIELLDLACVDVPDCKNSSRNFTAKLRVTPYVDPSKNLIGAMKPLDFSIALSSTGSNQANQTFTSCVVGTTKYCPETVIANCSLPLLSWNVPGNSANSGAQNCASGAGSCNYNCTSGSWSKVANTCGCDPQSIGNCDLISTNSGVTRNGTCGNGTTGSCSYQCNAGTWTPISNTCTSATCTAATLSNCLLGAGSNGVTNNGTCVNGTSGSCSYRCSLGNWVAVSNTCAPTPCSAMTIANCGLSAGTSGSAMAGQCVNGTIGSCNYFCSGGSWTTPSTNSCAAPAGCSAGMLGTCSIGSGANGQTVSGVCSAGTSGSCSYTCNNGNWGGPSNVTCVAPPSGCVAATVSNCSLTAASSGAAVTGTCQSGMVGSCSYTCTNGGWGQPLSNTCANPPPASCPGNVFLNCSLTSASSGTLVTGLCANGMTGICNYTCSNGNWTSPSVNSCSAPPSNCSATVVNNCSLASATSGTSANGVCSNGTTGACSYTCNNGSWITPSSNTCGLGTNPCSSALISNCSLSPSAAGASYSGVCSNGTLGTCAYTCSGGSWTTPSTNTCTAAAYTLTPTGSGTGYPDCSSTYGWNPASGSPCNRLNTFCTAVVNGTSVIFKCQ